MSVVLPAPFGPRIAVTSPGADVQVECIEHLEPAESLVQLLHANHSRTSRMRGVSSTQRFRCERGRDPLGQVQQIHEEAAQEHHGAGVRSTIRENRRTGR
jgi:hypothetical protein